MKKLVITLITLLFCTATVASDLAKEKRWADQIVDALIDGDEVWLKTHDDAQQEFLGIYTLATEKSEHAVIIMHGTGIHPDWQQVIQPLRVGLAELGWHTLSIQMPILPNDAKTSEYSPLYDEVTPRARAAINHLKNSGVNTIVIIGHSLGASMASYYLTRDDTDVAGFIGIGMDAGGEDKRMDDAHSISQIKIPVLDLYGSDDLDGILNSVTLRADAAKKANNKNYTQTKVAGANHFFDGKDEQLITTVANWLAQFKN